MVSPPQTPHLWLGRRRPLSPRPTPRSRRPRWLLSRRHRSRARAQRPQSPLRQWPGPMPGRTGPVGAWTRHPGRPVQALLHNHQHSSPPLPRRGRPQFRDEMAPCRRSQVARRPGGLRAHQRASPPAQWRFLDDVVGPWPCPARSGCEPTRGSQLANWPPEPGRA